MLPSAEDRAFRCSIAPEFSAARIKIGRRRYDANVLDTSRDGYTLRLPHKIADKLSCGAKAELWFRNEHWQIQRKSHYRDCDQFDHVGFQRITELTRIREPKSHGALLPKVSANADPGLLLYLTLIFIFACFALPGLGDNIGTAPIIRDSVKSVFDSARSFF